VIDRREATRYYFGAVAEVINLDSCVAIVSVIRNLSLSGCFIKTKEPFSQGAEVRLRITSSGADFAAVGKVTSILPSEGMGIEFIQIQPKDRALLQLWLGIGDVSSAER
jgi:hypothetical protein